MEWNGVVVIVTEEKLCMVEFLFCYTRNVAILHYMRLGGIWQMRTSPLKNSDAVNEPVDGIEGRKEEILHAHTFCL